ncbi:helix-turn-helix domain-containing protein [Streptomyces albus]|uniref:helix-turn-helix domain-containing protein n=1 Tax=Streptomyces albus TaxID=1888 RepID=UPI002D21E2D2|nr:helix-turn-helix domain-containing protein [Streptomyces albus]
MGVSEAPVHSRLRYSGQGISPPSAMNCASATTTRCRKHGRIEDVDCADALPVVRVPSTEAPIECEVQVGCFACGSLPPVSRHSQAAPFPDYRLRHCLADGRIAVPTDRAPVAAFLNVKKAARYLGISENTLYVWRHRRLGPPSFRMGGRVMYRVSALDEWVERQEAADSRSNSFLSPLRYEPQRRSQSTD